MPHFETNMPEFSVLFIPPFSEHLLNAYHTSGLVDTQTDKALGSLRESQTHK